jgi:hypothetical protein
MVMIVPGPATRQRDELFSAHFALLLQNSQSKKFTGNVPERRLEHLQTDLKRMTCRL